MALTPSTALTPAEKRAQRDAAEKDVLLREVDEAVRQDDFETFLATKGRLLLVAVVGALVLFGAYLFWQSRQEAARERDSETLIAGIDQLQANNLAGGSQKLEPLAAAGDSEAAFAAQMLRAGLAQQQGRSDEAAKGFAAIAANADAPAEMRDLAKVREIAIRYDAMAKPQVIAALKPLAVPGKPFFGSAGELLAHAYLDQNQRAEAGALFAQIAKDRNSPDSLRARTRQMAGLLGVDAIEDVDAIVNAANGTAPAN